MDDGQKRTIRLSTAYSGGFAAARPGAMFRPSTAIGTRSIGGSGGGAKLGSGRQCRSPVLSLDRRSIMLQPEHDTPAGISLRVGVFDESKFTVFRFMKNMNVRITASPMWDKLVYKFDAIGVAQIGYKVRQSRPIIPVEFDETAYHM
ncbi:MAG: hypothetical protein V7650_09525 [Parasphingorhabdus sp.]